MFGTRTARCCAAALVLALSSCGEPPSGVPDGGPPDAATSPPEDLLRADCDPLVPSVCALPFPSDHWLAEDPSTPTGHRLALGPTTLPRANVRGRRYPDPAPFNDRDGWSVNASVVAYLPGATATGLPGHQDLDASLAADSTTVLIQAETGERVPHFSEIDVRLASIDERGALLIRPVVVLEHGARYLVAIRGVVDAAGAVLDPPETFAAIRDGAASSLEAVEGRRAQIEAVMTELETYGVERETLQLAWSFTTGSLENDTQWMLSARDQALAMVGANGPPFTIDRIEELTVEQNASVARIVHGTMTVPNFMDGPEAGARLVLGPDGLPMLNGTADYPFVVSIPRSASPSNKVRPLQYGHGLLGNRLQARAGWLSQFGEANGFMPFGVDLLGMSDEDIASITRALANAELQGFATVPERLVQGMVNSLLAMRLMRGGFGEHEDLLVDGQSVVDTSAGFYTGDSQGGIFGGTYMALTTDVERGILGVPGQPYHLLLTRSVDFDPYLALMRISFGDDALAIQVALAAMQLLWDRAEPGSFTPHIVNDRFPNTPAHQVVLQLAIGDHQVTSLGAHLMARAIGAVRFEEGVRPIWGIDAVTGVHTGSAIEEFDFGVREPVENLPPREGDDPHEAVRRNPSALAQTLRFFETGEIVHMCEGPCDPE